MLESMLLTDLYQLTMLQAYFNHQMNDVAVFEFFVRRLPGRRNFLLAGGLEQVVDYLETAHFTPNELDWLSGSGLFQGPFIDSLADFHFTGSVAAMPEGTAFFANEPIFRVVAPLREAQLIESRIINLLQFQTLIASKAVRIRLAAPEHLLVDFGMRRAHGAEAGLLSARASYIAGFDGTATVLAGMHWGIPLYGTMAHSYVQVHDSERAAFFEFAHAHPNATTLLIDTYDTEAAARAVIPLARELAKENIAIQAVRIDSGELGEQARRVRKILDEGGFSSIKIFASGNLDENSISALVRAGAPIGGFGVGTRMATSADQPFLDCAYKLQEYAGVARCKRSEGKATWPGRKQVFRHVDRRGTMVSDTLAIEGEEGVTGSPLIHPVMRDGRRLAPLPPLPAIRQYVQTELAALPAALRRINHKTPFPLSLSPALRKLTAELDQGTEGERTT